MEHLEVPHPLARAQVDGDQALGEQVATRAVPTVVVGRRRVERHVDVTELGVDAHHRPDADLSGLAPRIAAPGVVAELVTLGDRVEGSTASRRCGRRTRASIPAASPSDCCRWRSTSASRSCRRRRSGVTAPSRAGRSASRARPRTARGMSAIRSRRPPSPKSAHGRPVLASTQTRYPFPVPQKIRSSVRSGPFDQYATPRWFHRALMVVVPSS